MLAVAGNRFAEDVFWLSVSVLVYVYIGYPLVLRLWAALARKNVAAANYTPSVCLLIAAND